MVEREREWSALLRAANAGDGRAYARFLHAVTPVLRGIVRARARAVDRTLHEEILQEALIAIHAKRHTWDQAAPLLPWLYAVTRYKVIDAFRRQGARVDLPLEDFAEVLAAPSRDLTAAHDVEALLARLDPRSASVVRAVSLGGEAADEVGRRLKLSEGAVRVVLHRAMRRLARLAKGEEHENR